MPNNKNKKKNFKTRGEYRKSKPYYKEGKNDFQNSDTPQHNDWQFYAASEEIARGLASIPFNYMGGTDFPLGERQHPLPCCITIPYLNSIGVTTKGTEGVNMAAAQLYTYIRHANSGAKNYEAADVMMYVLAMRDIYAQYFTLRKAIGLCSSYNFFNHNLPDLILKSMGVDATNLRDNLAQYRTRLNILAKKINSFAVPKYFKAFDRTAFINSYIFSDSSSIRGQFYNFVPAGFYKWSGKTSTHGTELIYTRGILDTQNEGGGDFSIFSRSLDTLLSNLEMQINALFLDTDALTMSGDILKAFPNAELYSIGQIPDDYQTSFIMDEDVLAQIENMRSIPLGAYTNGEVTESFNVTQADQLITFKPSFTVQNADPQAGATNVDQVLVNSHKDNPDYRDVLEWTRLVSTFDITNPALGTVKVDVTSSGLEICVGYVIATDGYVSELLTQWDKLNISPTQPDQSAHAAAAKLLSEVSLLSKFDWHPVKYIVYNASVTGLPAHEPFAWFADVKVATSVSQPIMKQINDGAVYGALYSQSMYNNTN